MEACTIAATTNQPSASTWKATSHTCSFSVASTPRYDTQAAAAVRMIVTGMLIHNTRVSSAMDGSENTWDRRRKRKSTATAARLDSTRTVAATSPQPPIQPSQGPNALVAHVNVVPESGIAVFSSR